MSTQQQERKGFFKFPTVRKLIRVGVALWSISFVIIVLLAIASSMKNKGGPGKTAQSKPIQTKMGYQSMGIDISPEVLKFIQNSVLEDMINAVAGWDSYIDKNKALEILNIKTSVDAETLVREYAENEVASDQKYKGENIRIVVIGIVESINKDFMGNPYVLLRGNDFFHRVQARFSDGEVEFLAGLKKEKKTLFVCAVDGLVIAQVTLRKCISLVTHAYDKKNRALSDRNIVDIFSGKRKTATKKGAGVLAGIWFLGQRLPRNSPCFNSNSISNECLIQTRTIFEFKSATEEDKVKLKNMERALSPE